MFVCNAVSEIAFFLNLKVNCMYTTAAISHSQLHFSASCSVLTKTSFKMLFSCHPFQCTPSWLTLSLEIHLKRGE